MDIKSLFMRALRTSISVAVGGLVTQYADNPAYMGLAPAISTIGKLIRQKWGWYWLPF